VTHLNLRLFLKKHENKDEQGQGPQFTVRRVLVPVPAVGRERYVLYDVTHQKHQRTNHAKLSTDFQEDAQSRLGRVKLWGDAVQSHRHTESQSEANGTNPRASSGSHNRQHLNID
jgi:hypothetical protein